MDISRGCELCQQGRWLCIFLTYKCNADCHFCPAPDRHDFIHSAFGSQKEEIFEFLKENDFEGISFSGGDPFLVFDRLLDWLVYFKKHFPDYYFWVYTNGLAVDRKKMELVAAEGMDEIRFNIAATGYVLPQIWEEIKTARELFPFVTVEIPSIKQDFKLLVEALNYLDNIKVDYLNLHDYILEEADNNSAEETGDFCLNRVIQVRYSISSLQNTKEIVALSARRNYRFHVHHCSMQLKERQMLQRRLKMGQIFNNSEYDILLKDGIVCRLYSIPSEVYEKTINEASPGTDFLSGLKSYLIPKGKISDHLHSDNKIISASYIPPIESGQGHRLLKTQVLSSADIIDMKNYFQK